MSNIKPNPFVLALEALCPVLVPSFTLRSVRDGERAKPEHYPLVDYVIVAETGATYDTSKNLWRVSYLLQLDFLLRETKEKAWCDYDELKENQDRQALHNQLASLTRSFLTIVVNPQAAIKNPSGKGPILKECDTIFSEYDFRFESFIGTNFKSKHGNNKLTGTSSRFVLSWLDRDGGGCCVADGSVAQWERIQKLAVEDSLSWKMINNLITP